MTAIDMTTREIAAQKVGSPSSSVGQVSFGGALRSELTKIRSVRSTR